MRPWFRAVGAPLPRSLRFRLADLDDEKATGLWVPHLPERAGGHIFLDLRIHHAGPLLGHLIHELCHAAADPNALHGPAFKHLADSLGLDTRDVRSAGPAAGLRKRLAALARDLGPYPAT